MHAVRPRTVRPTLHRRLATAATCTLLLAGGLATAPSASAAPVTGAGTSLTFSGDAGDYISGGRSWSYDPTNAVVNASVSEDHRVVSVNLSGDTFWSVDLAAPQGAALTPGTTYSATRYPFQSPLSAGFDLSGDGRGCNQSTSTFTVDKAVFGPGGYVQSFAATFEQHCENGTAAARGRVVLENPPPPPALAAKVWVSSAVVNASGSRVTLTGWAKCTVTGQVTVSGRLTQRASDTLFARGRFTTAPLGCTTTAKRWKATVDAVGGVAFHPGAADLTKTWSGIDPFFGTPVSGSSTGVVTVTTP